MAVLRFCWAYAYTISFLFAGSNSFRWFWGYRGSQGAESWPKESVRISANQWSESMSPYMVYVTNKTRGYHQWSLAWWQWGMDIEHLEEDRMTSRHRVNITSGHPWQPQPIRDYYLSYLTNQKTGLGVSIMSPRWGDNLASGIAIRLSPMKRKLGIYQSCKQV